MTDAGFENEGQIALVTGGGTGVGKAVSRGLSAAGWTVGDRGPTAGSSR